jgi:signal transduction histidine kinase
MPVLEYDVVLVCDDPAFEVALKHGETLWPGVPIVFCGIQNFRSKMIQDYQDITGVFEQDAIACTLKLIISMHPTLKEILVVSSGRKSQWFNGWQAEIANLNDITGKQVQLVNGSLAIYTPEKIVEQMAACDENSVVLLVEFIEAHSEQYFESLKDGAEMIRGRCPVPIYVVSPFWFSTGIGLGGSIKRGDKQGVEAAKMTVRILSGENAKDIRMIRDGTDVYMFEHSQLKRFDIPLSALPEGSIVVNEPISFYYAYKKQILAAVAVTTLLIVMVVMLAASITHWKVVEKKLLRYQQRLQSLAQDLSAGEDRQRKKIAAELTDCITEPLMILKLNIEKLLHDTSAREVTEKLNEVCECLDQAAQDTRLLTFDLSSPIVYETSFERAVADWLSEHIDRKYGIKCEFEHDGKIKPLSEEAGLVLFRIIRELLINVVKHSHASKVKVLLSKVDGFVKIDVRDNGIGFDISSISAMPTHKGGFGLFSIRERLERMNGCIEIDSAPGKGTGIKIIAPLN